MILAAQHDAAASQCQICWPPPCRLEGNIEKLSQQRDSINKQRKLTQEADGRTLKQLEQQYKALVIKNMEINMACQELESSVSQLQEEVGHSDDSSHDM